MDARRLSSKSKRREEFRLRQCVQPGLQVVWFKRDLRLADHRALAKAAARGPVLPLFVVEPELWRQPDMSGRQWAFLAECLTELRESLAALGQPLVVRSGSVVEVLESLHAERGIAALWSHQETGNGRTYARDLAVAAWCRSKDIAWHEERQGGTIRRLGSRNGWAKRWDAFMAEPETPSPLALAPLDDIAPGAIPSGTDLGLRPDACPERQQGGVRAAEACLHSFSPSAARPIARPCRVPSQASRPARASRRISPGAHSPCGRWRRRLGKDSAT